MDKITIVIVDDHTLVRAGLKLMLSRQDDMNVVGEAANAKDALLIIGQTKPSVVLLDISMPEISGLECLRDILKTSPKSKVILLTMHEESQYVKEGLAGGAVGYILKKAADEVLYQAIRSVVAGVVFLQPDTMQSILAQTQKEKQKLPQKAHKALSEKEKTVLSLIAQGFSNAEIAKELRISVKTVETYKYRIMEKLNAKKRSELVKFAMENGIVR